MPSATTSWHVPTPREVAGLLGTTPARWWLSGGVALEHWLGAAIRPHEHVDVSTVAEALPTLVAALPSTMTARAHTPDGLVPWSDLPPDANVGLVDVWDEDRTRWFLRVNVEDGSPTHWIYRRDPRLALPWERAVLDVDGVPTGAPAIQLLWKALRPGPEDQLDRDAVTPRLTDEDRAWLDTALLRIHPHSTWAIQVRSPAAPARPSWRRR